MTPETVMHLGYAAGRVLVSEAARRRVGGRPVVLIGNDTRSSGYMIEAALGAGFSATGVDVLHSGALPTPAVAYLTRLLHLQAGIVVSASHRSSDNAGLEFFSAEGRQLPEAVERAIEAEMASPIACVPPLDVGTSRRMPDPCRRYVDFCKSSFPADLDLRGLRLVLDCANGAGRQAAPDVFRELGAEVIALAGDADGCGLDDAGAPIGLAQAVRRHGAELGIALDGDGVRLSMADGGGRAYDGDQLLYVLARHLRQRGEMSGGVVGTVMSNLGLEHALSDIGIPFARAAVGDRFVLELLAHKQWRLGGESSGRIVCLDRHSTGDGIIAALQVLVALRQSGRSLAQLTQDLVLYPQRLIDVRLAREVEWQDRPGIARVKIEVETQLAGNGRALLRASGSEPLLQVLVEGTSPGRTDQLARRLAEAAATELGGEILGDAAHGGQACVPLPWAPPLLLQLVA